MKLYSNLFPKMRFIAGFALLGLVSDAHARAEDHPFSVGALGGLGFYNQSLGTQPTLGGTANYRFLPNMGVGVTAFVGIMGAASGAGNVSSMSYYNAHYNYYLPELLDGLWVGARLGLAHYYLSTTVTTSNSWNVFDVGPAAGYDYKIIDPLSVGLDLSYLFASVKGSALNSFNLLAAVKFYF